MTSCRSSRATPTTAGTCCATRRRTCWPKRSRSCSRAPSSRSARPSRTASTTTSNCRAEQTFSDDDLGRIEARMREIMQAEPAVHPLGDVDERGEGAVRRPDRTRSRSSRRSSAARRWRRRDDGLDAEVSADGVISVYRNSRRVRRHVRRSARAVDGPARPFQAAEGRRRVLARQREGADAAAHLRHGLGVEAGARRPPPPAGGGGQARPSQAGDRARPAELPVDARRRSRGVAPEGRHRSAS